MGNNDSCIINDVYNWLYDFLPLKNPGRLVGKQRIISVQELCTRLSFKHPVDYVYSLGDNTILVVSLQNQLIVAYNYITDTIEAQYSTITSDTWVDVFCLSLLPQQNDTFGCINWRNTDAALIYILTDGVQVIKLKANWQSGTECTFVPDSNYPISIPSAHRITKILPCREKEYVRYGMEALDTFYLWLPSKRLIQKYSLFHNNERAEPALKLTAEIKLKYPDIVSDSCIDSQRNETLSMCLDEVGKSVLVADAYDHNVFEFSLTEKDSIEIYPIRHGNYQLKDNMKGEYLHAPFFPLVLRPLTFVQDSLLSEYSLTVKKTDATGVLPRLILVFSNKYLQKIWQFPKASEVLDYSGKTIVSTLIEKVEQTSNVNNKQIGSDTNKYRSMSIGSAGQLAVVTEETLLLLSFGASFSEDYSHTANDLCKAKNITSIRATNDATEICFSNAIVSDKRNDYLARQIVESIDVELHNLSEGDKRRTDSMCHLLPLIKESPKTVFTQEVLSRINEYISIHLGFGNYDQCIELCNCIFSALGEHPVLSNALLQNMFLQAKAYRNKGQYPLSLETLCAALDSIEADEKLAYRKGSVLLRIGKVYSEYLMMMRVSIFFLEEAKYELSKWCNHPDRKIHSKARTEYAICLDSIGQYWREQEEYGKAISYFNEAEEVNRSIERQSGILRNKAHRLVSQMRQLDSIESIESINDVTQREELIREMQTIVRVLCSDSQNVKGAGVRYAQLADMYFEAGKIEDARLALAQSRHIARQHGDNKTLARAETIELKHSSDRNLGDNLREVMVLLKNLNYYHYQIDVNNLAFSAVKERRLRGFEGIGFLQNNRAIYLELSKIAKNTIKRISNPAFRSEFSHLSVNDRFSLLRGIIDDYGWFINSMNKIIDQLIIISKERSDSLNEAVNSEAKASLASSVIHDVKHVLTSRSGEIVRTELDPILETLNSNVEITPTTREYLINTISNTNLRLKTILPRIEEATRLPRDLHEMIDVRDIFLSISNQKPEEYQSLKETIDVECNRMIQIEYNIELLATLFKELLRNAIDFMVKNDLKVDRFILKAEKFENVEIGFINFSVLTEFQEVADAEKAYENIHEQLSGSEKKYGYGLKLLNNFMLCKTGGNDLPSSFKGDREKEDERQAGISFKVPIPKHNNTEER